jgi:hypothetical protein
MSFETISVGLQGWRYRSLSLLRSAASFTVQTGGNEFDGYQLGASFEQQRDRNATDE